MELDIDFINKCQHLGLIPTFCRIKPSNLCNISYKDRQSLQSSILSMELKHKHRAKSTLMRTYHNNLQQLKSSVSFLTYISIRSFLRNSVHKHNEQVILRHAKKLSNLKHRHRHTISVVDDNPNVVVNLSSYKLTDSEIMLLSRGLNFSVPPNHLDKFDVMTSFECLYRQLSFEALHSVSSRLKHKLKSLCYSYIYGYDPHQDMNLSKSELDALKSLKNNSAITICKPDKGNGVVVLNHSDYCQKINQLLNDASKFVELPDDPTITREKKLHEYLYYLKTKGVLDESTYQTIRPQGSKPGRIYGLPKIHKDGNPLRPIVSSIGTYTYELSKFLADILKPLANNQYTVRDSFSFANELLNLNDVHHMASFDVSSLFTNIPLQETIDICLDKLFQNCNKVQNLSRRQPTKLLNIALKENHFMFENRIYDQKDGVAMGSSLGPILANIFMSHFETEALSKYSGNLPSIYRRYVDDTFLIFDNRTDVDLFFIHMNKCHPNIKFTMESETNNTLPYLDILITRHSDGKLTTKVYRKPTYTGLYLRWDSFVPKQYKKGLVKCLLNRAWNICSSVENFDQEVDFIRSILAKNGYPLNFIDTITKNFIQSKYTHDVKDPEYGPEKRYIYVNLPFCGDHSQKLGRQLKRLYSKIAPWTKLILIFKPIRKLNILSNLKSQYNLLSHSSVVYKVSCLDCTEFYIGMTQRILQIRLNEHIKSSTSAIYNHIHETKHNINFTSPHILANDQVKLRLQIKETLHIKEQTAYKSLNQNTGSFPLMLW